MKFLLDQNLPVSLITLLVRLGHEAQHVKQLGIGEAADPDIWAEANLSGAVVVSKDSDFLSLAASGGQLVQVRVGNCPNRVLFAIVEGSWPAVVEQLAKGERVVELRG